MDQEQEARDIVGLALSGGGFRAPIFHLGVIRFLHEVDRLKGVKRLSSVSGGSVLAAHLALNWERYTNNDKFDNAAKELLQFVQRGIRGQIIRRYIFGWIALVPRFLLPRSKRWTLDNLLQKSFERLFKRAALDKLHGPEVFINSTSLTSGSPCYFGPEGFVWFEGDNKNSISSDETLVSFAVAASSAFPPLFPPITISYESLGCTHKEFQRPQCLTDGGVYDN